MNIGVRGKARQGIHRHLLIDVDLAAAVLVVEGNTPLHGTGDSLGSIRRTDARGPDKNVVADADLTVRAAVSHKSTGALGRNDFLLGYGGDVRDRSALKIVGTLAVLRVHMLTTLDVACRHADELAVLDDILARSDIDARNLVEEGDILSRNERGKAAVARGIADLIAGLKRVDCDDDIILVVDKNRISAFLHALRHPISLVDGRSHPVLPWCCSYIRTAFGFLLVESSTSHLVWHEFGEWLVFNCKRRS